MVTGGNVEGLVGGELLRKSTLGDPLSPAHVGVETGTAANVVVVGVVEAAGVARLPARGAIPDMNWSYLWYLLKRKGIS